MGTIVGGLDEAGRGPVIGPMVVAMVVMDEQEIRHYPVADSKLLTQKSRQRIFSMLPSGSMKWIAISAKEINRYMENGVSLNEVEAIYMARLIEMCDAEIYYTDCVGRYPENFANMLNKYTSKRVVPVIKGDRTIPIVSAASIVAKVIRDRIVKQIASIIGDFGSGYPSDPKTRHYIFANLHRLDKLSGYIRTRWKTVAALKVSPLDSYSQ